MIDYSKLEKARQNYLPTQIPFLTGLRQKLAEEKPYKGLKIFHNIPLTLQTVVKVEPLLLGGADVTVSAMSSIKPSTLAMNIFAEAGVRIQLDHVIQEDYDVYLDCCAELIDARTAQYGVVELTQTGTEIYKNRPLGFPVISVDDCLLKHLETISTGEGFVTALKKQVNEDIEDKKFVVFGYGKVGKGIVKALLKHTKNIVVVEKEIQNIKLLDPSLELLAIQELDRIKKHLNTAFCVVTATGIKDLLSFFFDRKDFNTAYLANMGAFDEFGKKFSITEVLFDKQALNFSIEEPTPIHYLDLIFYAHNISIDFLLEKKLNNGYHAFDQNVATQLLEKWSRLHDENFVELLNI